MILNAQQISDLFANQLVEHTEPVRSSHKRLLNDGTEILVRPWSKSKTYAGQLPGKSASCRVMVLSCVLDVPLNRWQLQLKIVRVQQESARLLKAGLIVQNDKLDVDDPRSFGYTERPSEALSREPEAIDEYTQGKYSSEAHERHTAFLESLDSMPLEQQLAYELRRAAELGTDDVHSRMAIQRRIRALRRKNDQRAA